MRLLALLLLLASCSPRGARPLPLPTPDPGSTSLRLLPLEADLRAIIRMHTRDTAEIAVALLDLATGDSLLIDGHLPMHAASTMKVPVMLELFLRADAGELALDQPIPVRNEFRSIADGSAYTLAPGDDSDRELYARIGEALPVRALMHRMITRSSNLATNLLIDLADPRRIERTLAEIGASGTRVLRGVEDGPAFRRGLNNTTTAYGLMKVLGAIGQGEAVTPASRAEILRILEEQEFREMIPAGLPKGTRVGNKTGWITGIQHDAALVLPEGRPPYVLVALTRGFRDTDAAASAVRHISRRVYYEIAGRDR